MRSERLLDLLLNGVEPVRHQNEPVASGSPWILRRHLGMGSFGEVWMAENPGIPIRRAYKFFTKDRSGEWLKREQKGLVAILNRLKQHDHIVQLIDVQNRKLQVSLSGSRISGRRLSRGVDCQGRAATSQFAAL